MFRERFFCFCFNFTLFRVASPTAQDPSAIIKIITKSLNINTLRRNDGGLASDSNFATAEAFLHLSLDGLTALGVGDSNY
jgi:hypothetical protein